MATPWKVSTTSSVRVSGGRVDGGAATATTIVSRAKCIFSIGLCVRRDSAPNVIHGDSGGHDGQADERWTGRVDDRIHDEPERDAGEEQGSDGIAPHPIGTGR